MMRILVIRLSSLGDVVLATAVLNHLRRVFPAAVIRFVTGEEYAGLFQADRRIDRVVATDRDGAGMGDLRGQAWDWVIDLQNNRRSRAIIAAAAPRAKVTAFDKLHGKRALLLLSRVNTYRPGDRVDLRYLRAAGWTGAGAAPAPTVAVDTTLASGVDAWLRKHADPARPLAALLPFSAWKNKQWPLDRFGQVARELIFQGWSTLVLGGPDEAVAASALSWAVGPHCASAAGEFTLAQTACVLSRCAVAVGNDSGLAHLARACGVRTAIVYGSTTWHWGFFPQGTPEFRIVEHPLMCRPCHAHGGNFCWRGSRPCLNRITAQRVVTELLSLSRSGPATIA